MRILQPGDYGLVGMTNVFFNICTTLQDAGLTAALVRMPNLTNRALNSAFWFLALAGSLAMAMGFFGAPLLAHLNSEPRLTPIARVLSSTLLIISLRAVPMATITRSLDFRHRTTAEVVSAAAGAFTGLALAYAGVGVWSLVYGGLATQIVLTMLSWVFAKWKPQYEFAWAELAPLLHFGFPLALATLLWQFYADSDFLVIGIVLGSGPLGWYTLAWQLAMVPAERLTAVMNKANLPVFARLQTDPEAVRQHWRRLIGTIGLVIFPMSAGLAMVGGLLIRLLLPGSWAGAVPVLAPLCVVGGIRSIAIILPSLLAAMGHSQQLLIYNGACSLVFPIIFFLAAHWHGLQGVAWAWVLTYPLFLLLLIYLGREIVPLRAIDYIGPLVGPTLITLTMAAAVYAVAYAPLADRDLLIAQIATGILVYGTLALLWLWRHGQLRRISDALAQQLRGARSH